MGAATAMTADLPRQAPGSAPVRRCIVSGETGSVDRLLRFVVGPEDVICPDLDRKLPGRGIWVGGRRDLLETAVKKRLFARAAKQSVEVAGDLPDQVEAALKQRCLNLLGLAKRAGQLTLGYEKTRGVLLQDPAAILVTARDASAKGREKLLSGAAGKPAGATAGAREIVDLFSAAELSLALGRENVVHAALRTGGLADRFMSECRRLKNFRPEAVCPT